MFFFINEKSIANYADDTYATNKQLDTLINVLEENTSTLVTWFKCNYFLMNADKYKLQITRLSRITLLKYS